MSEINREIRGRAIFLIVWEQLKVGSINPGNEAVKLEIEWNIDPYLHLRANDFVNNTPLSFAFNPHNSY